MSRSAPATVPCDWLEDPAQFGAATQPHWTHQPPTFTGTAQAAASTREAARLQHRVARAFWSDRPKDYKVADLAEELGCHPDTASAILHGKTWATWKTLTEIARVSGVVLKADLVPQPRTSTAGHSPK